MATRKIKIDIEVLKKGAQRKLGEVESGLARFGPAAKKAALAIGAAMVGIGVASVAAAVQIDNAMKSIAGSTGAAGAALVGLGQDFRAVLRQVPEDAALVATVMGDLNTLTGATGETLQALTIATLNASRALGEEGAAGSAANFARALNQFNIPASEGVEVMDDLFTIAQKTGVGLGALIDQTRVYGSVLNNAGFTMAESAGFFGQLGKAGIDVSRIMPGLNASFRNWAEAGLDGRDMLIQTVEAMKNAETQSEALNIATDAFGAEGAQRMTTAVRNGVIALDDLLEGLGDNEGAVGDASEATKTYGDKLNELKNKVTLLLEPLGAALLTVMTDVIESFTAGSASADKFGASVDRNKQAIILFLDILQVTQTFLAAFVGGLAKVVEGLAFAYGKMLSMNLAVIDILELVLPGSVLASTKAYASLQAAIETTAGVQESARGFAEMTASTWDTVFRSIENAKFGLEGYSAAAGDMVSEAPAVQAANNATALSFFEIAAAMQAITMGAAGSVLPGLLPGFKLSPPPGLAVPGQAQPGPDGATPPPGAAGPGGVITIPSGRAGFTVPTGGGGGGGGRGGQGNIRLGPGVISPFGFLNTQFTINVNAQGSVFQDDRSLDRLADLIADRMVRSGRLGATGGTF